MVPSDADERSKQDTSLLIASAHHEKSEMDVVVDALADERRRRTFQYVVSTGGPTGFDELVEHLIETTTWPTPRATDPNHVALRLYHVDLPKLAAADLVDYDREKRIVEATGTGDELGSLFDGLDG